MVGGDHANFSFARMGLDDSFDQTIGGLPGGGVEDCKRVAGFLFFSTCLTIENKGNQPAAGVVEFGKVADELLAGGQGLFSVKGSKGRPSEDDTMAVD
jgi:hypothetical protein